MSVVIEMADLFAGSGGTSTGALQAIAARGAVASLVAVNHWPVAVATHSANHPQHQHYCMNLETADPEDMVPGRRLDLLVASPECTHHSRARGGKPVSDQKRAGADWVLKWLERLDVQVLLVENVKEFMSWGDVVDGRPVSQQRGRHFLAWVKKLRKLGYRVEHKILNAADFGDVTTRERFFLIARKDGRPIRWPTPTHSKLGTSDMFGTLPKWRAAREIIDWSDLGPSLFTRPKPLTVKTRLRIARGLQRFGGWLAPLYIRLLDLPSEDEARFIAGCTNGPVRTFIQGRFISPHAVGVDEPIPTVVGRGAGYLVTPEAEAFTFANRNNATPHGTDQPIPTATTSTGGGVYAVSPKAEPFIAPNTENAVPKSIEEPFGTFTTIPGVYLASPTAEPFLTANTENAVARDIDEPIGTITTMTAIYLTVPTAEPFVIGQQSASAARSTDQPIPTVSTGGVIRVATPIASPFIDQYYATGVADGVDEPLATATTKPRHALVSPSAEPFVVPFHGGTPRQSERAHDIDEPLRTLTTEPRFGVATPIASVITPGFGENVGQLPRIHDIDEPIPAIAAQGHLQLATATIELPAEAAATDPRRLVVIDGVLHVLDIKFRMLKNSELAAAMGFPADYQFTGTKTDVTRQIGNAVCVNLAAALVGAILDESLPSVEVAS